MSGEPGPWVAHPSFSHTKSGKKEKREKWKKGKKKEKKKKKQYPRTIRALLSSHSISIQCNPIPISSCPLLQSNLPHPSCTPSQSIRPHVDAAAAAATLCQESKVWLISRLAHSPTFQHLHTTSYLPAYIHTYTHDLRNIPKHVLVGGLYSHWISGGKLSFISEYI